MIPFGEWLPDLPDLGNPGSLIARNVYPTAMGYRPVKKLTPQTNALDTRCLGAASVQDSAGNAKTFAADAGKIYELIGGTFTDVSKAGGYNTADDDVWHAAQFGPDAIATNFADPVQSRSIATSGAFADHFTSTEKPKAKYIGTIRNQLVVANVNDSTGAVANRVRWSALGNSVDMDPSSTTLAGSQDLQRGGTITGFEGFVEYGLVFQERAVNRMTFVGAPLVYDIQPVLQGIGTTIPNSITTYGRRAFCLTEEGFVEVLAGGGMQPLGDEKVDRTFWNQFDINNKNRLFAAVDRRNKVAMWLFPGTGSSVFPNKIIMIHLVSGKWAEIDIDAEFLFSGLTQGVNVDTANIPDIDNDPDSLTSVDDEKWKGGRFTLSVFDLQHRLNYMNGVNLAATIDTPEIQLTNGALTDVQTVRPIVDGGSPSIQVGHRNRQQDQVTFDTLVPMNEAGICPVSNSARYQRFRMLMAEGDVWDHAQGVKVLQGAGASEW